MIDVPPPQPMMSSGLDERVGEDGLSEEIVEDRAEVLVIRTDGTTQKFSALLASVETRGTNYMRIDLDEVSTQDALKMVSDIKGGLTQLVKVDASGVTLEEQGPKTVTVYGVHGKLCSISIITE